MSNLKPSVGWWRWRIIDLRLMPEPLDGVTRYPVARPRQLQEADFSAADPAIDGLAGDL